VIAELTHPRRVIETTIPDTDELSPLVIAAGLLTVLDTITRVRIWGPGRSSIHDAPDVELSLTADGTIPDDAVQALDACLMASLRPLMATLAFLTVDLRQTLAAYEPITVNIPGGIYATGPLPPV
jgi:hypothetical protein